MATPWYVKAQSIRKSKGLTYMDIANALGATEGGVGHWLKGRRTPNLHTIKRIAAVLETSLSDLVEDDPYYLVKQSERDIVDILRNIPEEDYETIKKILSGFLPDKD